ncbi:LamG-like jellyroll fold domain-containing protein [Mangrovimonas sp. TPBH4]|uniref:LamG-like jellyroll fold domain-containing protein n=1 Tax=Mangrovimonas sp. TPBH4 TaxID=1645914 RepID=UPI0006B63902|nr:LamG-like jellyroll fold domain-containing protein [Mangrovimonas sp. TPBH4]
MIKNYLCLVQLVLFTLTTNLLAAKTNQLFNYISLDNVSIVFEEANANSDVFTDNYSINLLADPPELICIGDGDSSTIEYTIYLDENGLASIMVETIDDGSIYDASLYSLSLNEDSFTCSNIGINDISLQLVHTETGLVLETCEVQIQVIDNIAPVLDCSSLGGNFDTDPGLCTASVSFEADVEDNCPPIITYTLAGPGDTITSPYNFPVGTTTVKVKANGNGSIDLCEFDVIVTDNQAPSFTGIEDITWGCGYSVSTPTGTDNCGGTINGTTSDPISFDSNGTYTINWNFDFGNGNVYNIPQNVTIQEINCNITVGQHVSCFGGNDGIANLNISGGIAPITVNWNGEDPNALSAGTYTVNVIDANGCSSSCSVTIEEPEVLSATATQISQVSCNGQSNGEATVNVSGGNSPYFYTWDNGENGATANNLDAGIHSVTITDSKGCNISTSIEIMQPETLSIDIEEKNDVSCTWGSDGTLDITPIGGTPPYNYQWSGPAGYSSTNQDIENLSNGNYTIIVTDNNGCQIVQSITITQPSNISLLLSRTNISCNGLSDGTLTANVAGGVGPYTYSWNTSPIQTTPTATNLANAYYTCIVTDANGCSKTKGMWINEPTALIASASSTDPSCFNGTDGTANASASGGTPPYTYQWSISAGSATTSSVSNISAGYHTVTITDNNGCQELVEINVTEPDPITVNVSGTEGCLINGSSTGGSATATPLGGTAPYSYLWNTGATTQTISGLAPGTYTVTVTDSNGCSSSSSSVTNVAPTELTMSATWTNTTGAGASNGTASATPSGGDAPYTYLWSNGETTSSISGLSSGTYTVTITDESGCTSSATVYIGDPLSASMTTSSECVDIDDLETLTIIPNISGGIAPFTLSWDFGLDSQTSPGIYSGTQEVEYATAGDKVITLTVTDASGQSTTISQTHQLAICYTYNVDCSKCNANDFEIGDFYIGDEDGNPIEECTGGTPLSVYIWFTTPSTAQPKYNLYVIVGYEVTDALTGITTSQYIEECLYEGEAIPVSSQGQLLLDDDYICGNQITLTGLLYSWKQHQNSDCLPSKPKCNCASDAITVIAPLAAVAQTTPVDCNGNSTGAGTVNATGGEAPYSYLWSNGETSDTISDVPAGTYSVTVTDAAGTITTANSIITEPVQLTATADVTSNYNGEDISCTNGNNGTATVTPSGGTAPYFYVWSNGQTTATATNLSEGTYTVNITDSNGCTFETNVTLEAPEEILTNITSTNPTCFGSANGTATVSVTSGGISPFTYQWSNGQTSQTANGLAANTNYSVIVTDANGCSVSNSVTLSQPNALQVNITKTPALCFGSNGGTATATPSGGTAPYSYVWSNSQTTQTATNLSAGSYTVTVTDNNGCQEIKSVTITQPSQLTATAEAFDASCYNASNGYVTVTVENGTPGYTYSWNTSPVQTTATASGLSAGTYSVTITDANGCTTTASATVNEPTELVADISGTNVSCYGFNDGTASVSVSGGTAPYEYTWNTSPIQTTSTANNLTAGNYQVIVEDALGCQITKTITITQPQNLTNANAGTDQTLNCGLDTTILNANTPTVGTGSWSLISAPAGASTSFTDVNQPNTSFSGDMVGTYVLRWTISSGSCPTKTDDVQITLSECSTLDFDGVNDNITFNNHYDLTGPFSLSVWVKPGSVSNNTQTILSKRDAGNLTTGYDLRLVNNTISFRWNGNNLVSPYQVSTQRWYHIAVTFSGSTYILYIDGIEVGSTNGVAPTSNSREFIVGAMDQTTTPPFKPINYFKGWMDELRIWNLALTQDQLKLMMNQEITNNGGAVKGLIVPQDIPGLSWSNLTAYYHMDQATDVNNGFLTGNTSTSFNGKLRNITTWQEESAPIPYKSKSDGMWTDTSSTTPWLYGDSVWDYPNGTGVNGSSIDWNIVVTDHNISSGNKDITLLGLLNNNGELTIADTSTPQDETNHGQGLRITHYLKLDGSIDLVGESQLIQDEGSILEEASSGYIERDQQGTSNLYNYNYWCSPVSPQNSTANNTTYTVANVLMDGTNTDIPQSISWIEGHNANPGPPLSITNRWIYTYNAVSNTYLQWNHVGSYGSIPSANGYTMKGSGANGDNQNYIFKGKPNNGTIQNSSTAFSNGEEFLIGNPYPSALDADEFIKDNIPNTIANEVYSSAANPGTTNAFDGTLYFWVHYASNNSHTLSEYEGGFAVYNLTGGEIPTTPPITEDGYQISGLGSSTLMPGRYIPVGQGFVVNALQPGTGGQIKFENDQRIFKRETGTGTSTFLRMANTNENQETEESQNEIKRIRISASTSDNLERHLLLGFVSNNEANDEFNFGYDAKNMDSYSSDVSWNISGENYVIQGVGPFDNSNQYPLNVIMGQNGNLEIMLREIENFEEEIEVFVYDSLTGTYTQINQNAFEIQLDAGYHENRFYITFETDNTLATIDRDFESIVVNYLNHSKEIYIRTPQHLNVKQVYLTNIIGQTVKSWNATNTPISSEFKIPVKKIADGNYIIKVVTDKGSFNKKVVIKLD